jgi:diguanylate cyclase (GGDEF) domain/hemerythrin-like metal-binding domain
VSVEKPSILIVDDRPENLISLEALLRDDNINIVTANSGEKALSIMIEMEFSLVLMDVQMPEMDGFEVASLMRGMKKTRNIPIIFVTAISKEQQYIFKGYEVGAIDYIYKPIDSVILKSKVQVFLELFKQKKLYQIQAIELENRVKELEYVKAELEEANRLLSHLSSHDGLTGILNRRSFDEIVEREWNKCYQENSSISIILLDVDFFKKYNDIYGHVAGDNCLKLIAKTISKTAIKPSDYAVRYGGEEFAVILPKTNEEEALKVAEQIRLNIKDLGIEHRGSSIPEVTVSLGIAESKPSRSNSIENMIHRADKALYRAKCLGRNQSQVSKIEIVDIVEQMQENINLIQWNNTFETGISAIDEQHRILINKTNELYSLIIKKNETINIKKTLDELLDYTYYHFREEELFLETVSYIYKKEHAKEHLEFKDYINNLLMIHNENISISAIGILTFLNKWIINHIKISDMEYTKHI